MSLDSAIQHLLKAKRISAPSQSYAKDNPAEWQKVKAYLEGGARPTGVMTEMGLGLMEVEEVRRGASPPPPPPPPAGTAIATWQIDSTPTDSSVFNQSWLIHTSPSMGTRDDWGGQYRIRQMRTPPLAQGSWEWWTLHELWLPTNWSSTNYALGLDAHNVPGDVGWGDGASEVSSIHYKMRGGNYVLQHERQQEAGSGPHEFTIMALPKGQWLSIAFQHILGRLDGSVSSSGHPNGGKGRTRCWINGNLRLDTGDINLLHRNGSRVQQRLDVLQGLYNPNVSISQSARMTVMRIGRTLAEAQADAPVLSIAAEADTGAHNWSQIASRSTSDFIAPQV